MLKIVDDRLKSLNKDTLLVVSRVKRGDQPETTRKDVTMMKDDNDVRKFDRRWSGAVFVHAAGDLRWKFVPLLPAFCEMRRSW